MSNEDKAELLSDIMGGWLLINLPDQENTMLQGTYTGIVKYKSVNNSKWEISKIPIFCKILYA